MKGLEGGASGIYISITSKKERKFVSVIKESKINGINHENLALSIYCLIHI